MLQSEMNEMSQLYGVWSFQRENEPNRAEIRLHVMPGNRRPFDVAHVHVNLNVLTFPHRGTFDTPWSALQFVRERRSLLQREGWRLALTEGLARGFDLDDHGAQLDVPVIATGVIDGVWTYRLPQDGSIAYLRVRVSVNEAAPYFVSSAEFDAMLEPCPDIERSLRVSRQSPAVEFLRTEARAFNRQGWELIARVGLAGDVDLLDEDSEISLPEAVLATQEAAWEFRDRLTGEEHKAELLVHGDRVLPFEVTHFQRRANTTRWYANEQAAHFEDLDSAMEAIRAPTKHLFRIGCHLVRTTGMAQGIDPTDEFQELPIRSVFPTRAPASTKRSAG